MSGVERADALRSGSRAIAPRARLGLLDRSSAPRRSQPHRAVHRSTRSPRCGGCASQGRRSPSCSDAALDDFGGPQRGSGWAAWAAWARAGAPLRARPAGRADSCRHQEARPHPAVPASASPGQPGATTPAAHRRATVRAILAGWDFVHIAIDDATRLAYAESSPTRRRSPRSPSCGAPSPSSPATAFTVERLLTDNGSPYRSTDPRDRLPPLGIRHLRTRPRPPADQRQGRALHPHPARRLGLRRDLRLEHANAPLPLTAGSGTTTIAADTKPSAATTITRLNNLLGSYS